MEGITQTHYIFSPSQQMCFQQKTSVGVWSPEKSQLGSTGPSLVHHFFNISWKQLACLCVLYFSLWHIVLIKMFSSLCFFFFVIQESIVVLWMLLSGCCEYVLLTDVCALAFYDKHF